MVTINQAIQFIEQHIVSLPRTVITLKDAVGYVLAEDVLSPINMPPFRQSAMDGYAICNHTEKKYTIIGEVKAGDSNQPVLRQGEAVRIFTGAAVPDTANAIVIQEKVSVENGVLNFAEDVILGSNIRPMGEQIRAGEVALTKGTKLMPAAIGFLASLGIEDVSVYKQPSVAVVTTGNELIESGKSLKHGEIYESNSLMLSSVLKTYGFNDISIYKIEDDYDATYTSLKQVLTNFDLVLITGGISVGDYDFVGQALRDLKVNELFYKVKQKPGKPLFFGKTNSAVVFGLPGNPASALTCFYVYVRIALELMIGNVAFKLPKDVKKASSNFIKKGDRPQFLKAYVSADEVKILTGQNSSMQQTFALANSLAFIPEEVSELKIGDMVEVITLN